MKQTNIAQTEQKAQEDAYEVCRDLDGTPLTHYVLAERLVQVEYHRIMQDTTSGPSETLIYILEGGYRGFTINHPQSFIQSGVSVVIYGINYTRTAVYPGIYTQKTPY